MGGPRGVGLSETYQLAPSSILKPPFPIADSRYICQKWYLNISICFYHFKGSKSTLISGGEDDRQNRGAKRSERSDPS